MADYFAEFLASWPQPKRRISVGSQLVSGDRLYLCDPLDIAEHAVTTQTPTGTFAVVVYQRDWTPHRTQPKLPTNAFLALEFSDAPTVRWEQLESQSWMRTEFSAEFGSMSIVDADTRQQIIDASNAVENAFDDWLAKYTMIGDRVRDFAFVPLHLGGFVVARSGWSNGTYNAFLGRGDDGNATQLVVDFGIQ